MYLLCQRHRANEWLLWFQQRYVKEIRSVQWMPCFVKVWWWLSRRLKALHRDLDSGLRSVVHDLSLMLDARKSRIQPTLNLTERFWLWFLTDTISQRISHIGSIWWLCYAFRLHLSIIFWTADLYNLARLYAALVYVQFTGAFLLHWKIKESLFKRLKLLVNILFFTWTIYCVPSKCIVITEASDGIKDI